jgi:hypothetical protein
VVFRTGIGRLVVDGMGSELHEQFLQVDAKVFALAYL